MKWIGQHIIDLIARFRSDVYLEDIDTGTIASGGNLGLDSNNKIVKATTSSGGISHDGSTANGVLTFKDADEATVEANLSFNGSFLHVQGVADISPSASAGYAALTIDARDVDQIALDIDAKNTTANVVDISAQKLTSGAAIKIDCNSLQTLGNAIEIDVDDAQTVTNIKNLSLIDYNKSGVTGSGQGHYVAAHQATMVDSATNHTGSFVQHQAYKANMLAASGDGNVSQIAFKSDITGGDDAYFGFVGNLSYRGNVSFFSDSSGSDFIAVSPLDHGDYFEIAATTHGATTLKTVDDDGAAAHLEIEADGNITLDAVGQIKLEVPDGDYIDMYNTTNKFASFYTESGNESSLTMYEMGGDSTDDFLEIYVEEHGATTLETVDAAAAAAHFTINADGDIILTAAGQIKLQPGTSVLWDSLALTGIQASSESFADNDVSLMTSAAIEDKIQTTLPTKSLHYVHGDIKDSGSDMTNEHFLSLGDADRESTNELSVAIPIVIPGTGVLKRVIKRTQSDFSAKAWSYKFRKAPSGTALGSASLIATVTKNAGGAANTNSIIDFTTDASDAANACTFETGFTTSTQFNAGDSLLFSYQCTSGSGPSGTPKIIWTLVFELDDTTAY